MNTYVLENVLYDWSAGLIVVKAESKKEALKRLEKEFDKREYKDFKDKIRLLKNNELVYVFGGG